MPTPTPLSTTREQRPFVILSPLQETPPPEVVDSFPKVVVNPGNSIADRRNGRLKLFASSSADAMTLDQSRKQTRETGSVIIPVLQNANSVKNACSGKKTSLSGLQHCGQACCVVRHRGETVQRRSLAGAPPRGWGARQHWVLHKRRQKKTEMHNLCVYI